MAYFDLTPTNIISTKKNIMTTKLLIQRPESGMTFRKLFKTPLMLISMALIAVSGCSQAQELDSKYQPVPTPLTVSTGEKIEVTELFWFGCSHCYALEPHVKEWLKNKPENAEFKKVPALFTKAWEFHGQAFYTMETLDVPEQAYDKFFSRIHVDRKGVNSLNSLVEFLADYDKSKEQVEEAFNSFAVDTKMRNARKITRGSGARGVPAIIVDGKYLTSQQLSGGSEKMFDVVNQLVEKAAAER